MRAKTRNQKYRRAEKIRRRESEREMKEAVNESRGQTRTLVLAIIAASVLALALIIWIVPAHADARKEVFSQVTEYSFVLSALLLWVPTGFFIATSILGLSANVGAKRMLSFYALMLVGAVSGIAAGEAMSFFINTIIGVGIGFIVGGIVGGAMGAFSCGLLTKEKYTVEGHVFLLGWIVSGIIGLVSGALAGAQNHRSLFAYLMFLLTIQLLSFVIAQFVRFVRNLMETFKAMAGW